MCADNYLNIIPVLCRRIGIPNSEESRFAVLGSLIMYYRKLRESSGRWNTDVGCRCWDLSRSGDSKKGKWNRTMSAPGGANASRKRCPVVTRVTASRWRLHYRVHGKSRVYKLMHVKSLGQNRPTCIMERNAVRARSAGLFRAVLRASSVSGVEGARGREPRGRPVTLLTDTMCMD